MEGFEFIIRVITSSFSNKDSWTISSDGFRRKSSSLRRSSRSARGMDVAENSEVERSI
jgi:hypothetical protein